MRMDMMVISSFGGKGLMAYIFYVRWFRERTVVYEHIIEYTYFIIGNERNVYLTHLLNLLTYHDTL